MSNSRLSGIQGAYPLGISNGRILTKQIFVPELTTFERSGRYVAGKGWKALGSFFTANIAKSRCFASMVGNVPKSVLGDAPLFFQVDFIRAKKVIYLVLMEGNKGSTAQLRSDRAFGLSYRDITGNVVVYGESPVYAEVCDSFFLIFL